MMNQGFNRGLTFEDSVNLMIPIEDEGPEVLLFLVNDFILQ